MTTTRDAYVWRRHLSYDQLSKIESIQRLRECLDAETVAACAFARCQLRDSDRRYVNCDSFHGIWDGLPTHFRLNLRPLFLDYVVAVYSQAIRDAVAYYPHFARYSVVDGPLIGERRLVFPDKLDEAAAYWIRCRFYQLAEKGNISVSESFSIRPVDTSRFGGGREFTVDVSLDHEHIDEKTSKKVSDTVSKGKPFPVNPKPRKCDVKLVSEMLTELSLPELVALNWNSVKKPLTEADRRLFAAINEFDINAAAEALAAGADPNAVSESNKTPLTAVVLFRWIERRRDSLKVSDCSEEYFKLDAELGPSVEEIIRFVNLLVSAGAAVDWATFNEETPLAEAALNADAAVVTCLLEHGADPSIRCFSDDHPGEWGNAWESAHYLRDLNIDNDDDRVWNALIAKWPAPFGNVRVE
jgi:hypothetical protein